MMERKENIIELKNIKKCYDKDVPVIDGFNLEVQKGEFVTFLGLWLWENDNPAHDWRL